MIKETGVHFEDACVVDGRMNADKAQKVVSEADVVWLAGGDPAAQYAYLVEYGLDEVLRQYQGVIIGMRAGSINLAKTAICTHHAFSIYDALGCVDISVVPHFDRNKITDALIQFSKEHTIYGLCDDSVIVCADEKTAFYGDIYKLSNGIIEQLSV